MPVVLAEGALELHDRRPGQHDLLLARLERVRRRQVRVLREHHVRAAGKGHLVGAVDPAGNDLGDVGVNHLLRLEREGRHHEGQEQEAGQHHQRPQHKRRHRDR